MSWFIRHRKACIVIVFFHLLFETDENALYGQSFSGLYYKYSRYLSRIKKEVLSDFFFKGKTSEKVVAITFDDGPLKNTPNVIQYLKEEKIPATFFLVMKNVDAENARLYDDTLFSVGIHTYDHRNYASLTYKEKKRDIEKCLKVCETNAISATLFRPAFGIICKQLSDILTENDLTGVIWTIDAQDWNGLKGEKLAQNVASNLESGSIILLHDRITLNDLKAVINAIKEQGFEIISLEELMLFENEVPDPDAPQKNEIQLDDAPTARHLSEP